METDRDEEEDDQGGHWSPFKEEERKEKVKKRNIFLNSLPSCLRPEVTE